MNLASIALLAIAFQTPAQTSPNTLPANTDKSTTAAKAVKVESPTASYTNEELGLTFDHPRNWKTSKVVVKTKTKFDLTDPKSWRPPRNEKTTKFLMPLPGVDEKGVLEIFAAQFYSEAEIWQASQRDINVQLKRTVLRQWSEEIMGVPLLMTKIQATDKGVTFITETGLIYSQTPRKLVFRVTASPDNFDKADYEWRQAIQTLRTSDGRLPSAEDPNRKLGPQEITPGTFRKTIWTVPAPVAPKAIKGSVTTETAAGGKKLLLHTPAGWKVQRNSDGTFLLSGEASGTIKVSVFSDVDSDPAGKALIRSSGLSLTPYTKVVQRIERGPYESRSQTAVVFIYRRGLAGSKPISTFDASGANGDYYWLLTWTGNENSPNSHDQRAIEGLIDIMSVELAP